MSSISLDAVLRNAPDARTFRTFDVGTWPSPKAQGAHPGPDPAAAARTRTGDNTAPAERLRAGAEGRLAALEPGERGQILFQAFGAMADELALSPVSTPRVVVVPQETLGRAPGAYSTTDGGTIYLSAAANADPDRKPRSPPRS